MKIIESVPQIETEDRRINSELRQMVFDLEFKSYIHQAQQGFSLDGILVVDMDWNMISFNQQLISMWQIPEHILEEKDDRVSL